MTRPSADGPVPHRSRSVAGLTVVSAVSAVSPLIALPLITRASGPDGFFNIATGQAIGTLAATVILFGWNIAGPVRVARASEADSVVWDSTVSRGLLALAVLPLAAAVAVLATTAGDTALAVWSALAFALQGLSITWYAVGTGRPRLSLVFDALPRLVGNLLGGVLALAFADAMLYPITVLTTLVLAFAAFLFVMGRRSPDAHRGSWSRGLASYRTQWRPAATAALLTFSETSPMTALGVSGSASAVGFAPFDRVLKYGYIGVYMVTNSFQGWVASASGGLAARRMRRAVVLHLALAVVGGAGFALVGPWFVPFFLGPGFVLSSPTALFGGIALAAMTMTTVLGLCVLLPAGRDGAYLAGVGVAAVSIIPAVLGGAAVGGVAGAAGAVAAVQIAALTVIAVPAAGVLRARAPREEA
jgi:O-antigen/teichoic acid export membrane protein